MLSSSPYLRLSLKEEVIRAVAVLENYGRLVGMAKVNLRVTKWLVGACRRRGGTMDSAVNSRGSSQIRLQVS